MTDDFDSGHPKSYGTTKLIVTGPDQLELWSTTSLKYRDSV